MFFSDDCQNWKLLPVPQNDHIALTELCKTPFQGDPGLVIEIVDDDPSNELFPGDDSGTESDAPEDFRIQSQLYNGIPFDNKVLIEDSNEVEETKSKTSQDKRSALSIKTVSALQFVYHFALLNLY